MSFYRARDKARKEYKDCRLCYKLLSNDSTFADLNAENIEKMQKVLKSIGVSLIVTGTELDLVLDPDEFAAKQHRNAGRRAKIKWKKDVTEGSYKYSDIVYMMQFMTDKEISEKIEMPIATYYRHKKEMKESYYFNSLDLNRLKDKEYLDDHESNISF